MEENVGIRVYILIMEPGAQSESAKTLVVHKIYDDNTNYKDTTENIYLQTLGTTYRMSYQNAMKIKVKNEWFKLKRQEECARILVQT